MSSIIRRDRFYSVNRPEDVYHTEFVERLLNIIPFAT